MGSQAPSSLIGTSCRWRRFLTGADIGCAMAKPGGGSDRIRRCRPTTRKKKRLTHPGRAWETTPVAPRERCKGQRRQPNAPSGQRFPPSSTARARLPGLARDLRLGSETTGGDARLEAVWRRLFLVGDQCIRNPCPAELMAPRGVSFAWLLGDATERRPPVTTGHRRR